ncbi:uncharacterized protein LOC132721460 [Ruditapes philippinarum]|uniref:uncharacterized protein LOC132721460 n=1 Tax=Ruditapes philippinarum TaxID=129788 RepID=UPI00295C35C7|nr:uncharacterized protein LOC132721460 [Ruditapes philippinarum]
MVLVKPGLDCEDCPDLDSNCEIKWVKVTTSKQCNILVGAFYREPKSQIETLNELDISLGKIGNSEKYRNCKIFLGGDFNLGDIDWEYGNPTSGAKDKAHCEKLCSILNLHFIEQVNLLPTRMNRTLDLFITSHPTLIEKCSTGPPLGLSDHDCLFVTSKLRAVTNKKQDRTVYNYKKADWQKLKDLTNEFKSDYLAKYQNNSVDTNWVNFKDTLFRNMDKCIPTKKLKNKQDIPWLHKDTKRMLRKKKRLYKRARKTKSSEDYEEFKLFRVKARNKLHSDYHKYLNNLLDPEQDSTSKKFWKYIKARKQDSVSIGTLKSQGVIADSAESKANLLNSQFSSVFTNENLKNIPDKGQSPYIPMNDIIISENGVKKCIERLNEQKASGPDKIPIKVLKTLAFELAPIMTSIFQQSLLTGEIPLDWKQANVVPIFKKGDRSKPENYRPVSLTVVVSTILEHIVVSQIMNHLDSQSILHENQHGFRSKRSCESQLLMTNDDIAKSLNSGTQVDMAILDFSFDKVSHRRLSHKLEYYVFPVILGVGLIPFYLIEHNK